MMPASVAPVGVAAAVARAQRRVISRFLSANAVTPGQGIAFDPERRLERKVFQRLQRADVIRPTSVGSYYLDAPALDVYQRSRRKRIGVALAGAAAALAAAVGIGIIAG